jgi:hypothetical protein
MPSKGFRNAVIDGLEVWYQVPEKSLNVIRQVINLLHSSSLMYASPSLTPELQILLLTHSKGTTISRTILP